VFVAVVVVALLLICFVIGVVVVVVFREAKMSKHPLAAVLRAAHIDEDQQEPETFNIFTEATHSEKQKQQQQQQQQTKQSPSTNKNITF
jgi:type III secretory pathway component EscR